MNHFMWGQIHPAKRGKEVLILNCCSHKKKHTHFVAGAQRVENANKAVDISEARAQEMLGKRDSQRTFGKLRAAMESSNPASRRRITVESVSGERAPFYTCGCILTMICCSLTRIPLCNMMQQSWNRSSRMRRTLRLLPLQW